MLATANGVALVEPMDHLNCAPHLVELTHDSRFDVYRCFLKPTAPRYFTPELLEVLLRLQRSVRYLPPLDYGPGDHMYMQYHVLGSRIPGVFSLGGDLGRLEQLIHAGDRNGLRKYGKACLGLVLDTVHRDGPSRTTIALVQGLALGGGFEAALACDVLIAERGSELGFPEVLFNLFPGMGAYSLLLQRVAPGIASRLIESGRRYSAEELHELGVIDILADPRCGDQEVSSFIRRHRRSSRGINAFCRSKQIETPIDRDRLIATLEIWVDCALSLRSADMRILHRFAVMQHATTA